VTVQAINALNEVDVFFVIDKGKEKEDLVRLRKEICDRFIENKSYRTVEAPDPPRDRLSASYESAVGSWHEQRAELYERLIGRSSTITNAARFWCGAIRRFTTAH
jgi:precorrin-6A synthase